MCIRDSLHTGLHSTSFLGILCSSILTVCYIKAILLHFISVPKIRLFISWFLCILHELLLFCTGPKNVLSILCLNILSVHLFVLICNESQNDVFGSTWFTPLIVMYSFFEYVQFKMNWLMHSLSLLLKSSIWMNL